MAGASEHPGREWEAKCHFDLRNVCGYDHELVSLAWFLPVVLVFWACFSGSRY
jgi:hypothetical protein